jgi:hypothetical protein
MENFLAPTILPGLMHGKLQFGLKATTKLQMIAVDDIGKFGLMLFERHEKMNGAEVDIAGDERTMPKRRRLWDVRWAGKSSSWKCRRKCGFGEEYAIMLEWLSVSATTWTSGAGENTA